MTVHEILTTPWVIRPVVVLSAFLLLLAVLATIALVARALRRTRAGGHSALGLRCVYKRTAMP